MKVQTAFQKVWRAVILDLDGVVTRTASLHAQAWKRLFDEFLATRPLDEAARGPFDEKRDYFRYVDGKPREDGVRSFLESRGISLPHGSHSDDPHSETCHGLGNRKDGYFKELLRQKGPEVFEDAVDALHQWRSQGLKTAVASSSKNCGEILELADLHRLFDVRVDGTHLQEWGMPGKPAPDMFLAAAAALETPPEDCILVEDAIAGIEAARKGHFGYIVGVARHDDYEMLRDAGADRVVSKLTEIPFRKEAA
ncbi:MAG: hypothetical protein A2X94_01005 [Bdellovibrionales bacterium GWB1_55_8]|nr:MAG: hypothetical protein A2X94_01005 [Bdellovibrionales bacterium GWB1_55_8]